MQIQDIHSLSEAQIALASQTISTDTDTVGAIIDTKDFEALEFLFASGTITDGAYAVKLQHGDDSGLSDSADVSAAEMLGNADYALTDDDTAKRMGYIGKKRYVRVVITSTGTSSGGTLFSAMAFLYFGRHNPTSDQ